MMKRIRIKFFVLLFAIGSLLTFSGCTSLLEEDPNEAQIPWATPADWEGQVPGMPGPGGF